MKKILAIILIYTFAISQANAKDGFYVGADAAWSHAKHKFKGTDADYAAYYDYPRIKKIDRDALGYGVNAGYKFNYNNILIAPEIFYDKLKNRSHTYAYDYRFDLGEAYRQDEMTIDNRYGGKLNLGYNFNEKFSVFVNAGLAVANYSVQWVVANEGYRGRDLGGIYGAGFLYNLNDKWALKFSYDHQIVKLRYVYRGLTSRASLDVMKAGVVFSF